MKHWIRTHSATAAAGACLLGLSLLSTATHSQEPAYAETTVEATATTLFTTFAEFVFAVE